MKKIKKSIIYKIILLIIVILAFIIIKPLNQGLKNMLSAFKDVESVKEYIRSFGVWAVVISFLMMILQALAAPIPAFFITFANAAIWGWWKGAILSWTSAMAGAAICFILSRIYGRELAERLVSKMALDEVDVFFERYGKNAILVARLLPFVPFDPISYAAGLTSIKFKDFFIATGIGQLPATIVYSYASAKSSNPSSFVKGLLLLFGISALVYTMRLIWIDKNKDMIKEKELDMEEDKEVFNQDKIYVSGEWLNNLIEEEGADSDKFIILEVSWGDISKDYEKAHIPGAIHMNTDLIEEEVYWNIRSPEEIEKVFKEHGITKNKRLITYGNNGVGAASRMAFVGLWAGIENVHVLEGGFEEWLEGGFPLEEGNREPDSVPEFGGTIPAHPEYLISIPEEILERQKNDNFKLISIRSWEEFIGETSGYSYIQRTGEPLGALWGHDADDYYNSDGSLKSMEDIQTELWKELDIDKSNEISFYCGTGWRATIPFLIAYENGWKNITLFDGGWYVWQMNEDLPIQTGEPR